MTGVLKRRGEVSQRHGEDIQVKTEAEVAVVQPQARNTKDCQELPQLEEASESGVLNK